MADYFERNKAWTLPGEHNYSTDLGVDEPKFQSWVKENKVPFDPKEANSDYDMRGFYKAVQDGDPRAKQSLNPNDSKMHYTDYWKTPYHKSFSNESQWADPAKAPHWNEQDQLVAPSGQIIMDEKAGGGQQENFDPKKHGELIEKIVSHPEFTGLLQTIATNQMAQAQRAGAQIPNTQNTVPYKDQSRVPQGVYGAPPGAKP